MSGVARPFELRSRVAAVECSLGGKLVELSLRLLPALASLRDKGRGDEGEVQCAAGPVPNNRITLYCQYKEDCTWPCRSFSEEFHCREGARRAAVSRAVPGLARHARTSFFPALPERPPLASPPRRRPASRFRSAPWRPSLADHAGPRLTRRGSAEKDEGRYSRRARLLIVPLALGRTAAFGQLGLEPTQCAQLPDTAQPLRNNDGISRPAASRLAGLQIAAPTGSSCPATPSPGGTTARQPA